MARHDAQVDALGLVGQLLDRMIVGKRPPKDQRARAKVGYYVLDEDDVDRYVRSGSVAIDRWGAPEDGSGIDWSQHWKAL
jgi:hypothetical protein